MNNSFSWKLTSIFRNPITLKLTKPIRKIKDYLDEKALGQNFQITFEPKLECISYIKQGGQIICKVSPDPSHADSIIRAWILYGQLRFQLSKDGDTYRTNVPKFKGAHLLSICLKTTSGKSYCISRKLIVSSKQTSPLPTKTNDHKRISHELFDENEYLKANDDVRNSGMPAFDHYIGFGIDEGRLPNSKSNIEKKVRARIHPYSKKKSTEIHSYLNHQSIDNSQKKLKVAIITYSTGNFFFHEIAEYFRNSIESKNTSCTIVNESCIGEEEFDHYFLIAPHEVFYLDRNSNKIHEYLKGRIEKTTYYLTEQPQTTFHQIQLKYLFEGAHLLNLNLLDTLYLRSFGLNVDYLPLYYSSKNDYTAYREFSSKTNGLHIPKKARCYKNGKDISQRPFDISFIGNCCGRRKQALCELTDTLSKYDTFLFTPDWTKPHTDNCIATLNKNDSLALSQRSKICLNIHRDTMNYFEWHRIVLRNMISGAVTLTEPVNNTPEFTEGEDYIACSLESFPKKIDWLLSTEEGLEMLRKVQKKSRENLMKTNFENHIKMYLNHVT